MSAIRIIIAREFNQRVRKRSFIITTILTPLLMVGLMVAPAAIMMMKGSDKKVVEVVDRSGAIVSLLESSDNVIFLPESTPVDGAQKPTTDATLIIEADILTNPSNLKLYTKSSSTLDFEKSIERQVKDIIESKKLAEYDIENLPQIMEQVKTPVSMQVFKVDEQGNEKASSSMLSMAAAYLFGFLIYMFVLLYGVMVMQGVIEEKSSKVLEIMVSSVKPFQLMMGKIIGIASVAIVQFFIWIVLIFVLGTIAMQMFAGEIAGAAAASGAAMGAVPAELQDINPEAIAALKAVLDPMFLLKLFGGFILYFIGGYLLYAAMFAAVGSAVDDVADSQQLQMPITIPLIFGLLIMMTAMKDPNSTMAVWFSIIPFTSPIVMMARIPYGVPVWQLLLSLGLLYSSFIAMVWLASKIYRVGIFMYGKKPSWKELYKWIKYKY